MEQGIPGIFSEFLSQNFVPNVLRCYKN